MISRAENLLTWLAAAVYAGLLVFAAYLLGALGIARNDDWSFLENAFRFQETGIFAVGGWVQMNLIGQLIVAAPLVSFFGDSITALQVLGVGFTGIAVAATYFLARSFLSRRFALTIAATTAASPVLMVISVSFMTDSFAFAGQVSALVLAAYAVRARGSARSLMWWAAIAVGLWAFSIREFSAIALVAIALFALLTTRIARWQRISSIVVIALGAIAIIVWRSMQVTETPSSVTLDLDRFVYIAALPVTLGFLTLPVIAWIRPVALARRFDRTTWITFGVVALVAAALVASARVFIAGNYFQQVPAYASVIPGSPEAVYPSVLWWVVLALGAIGAAIGVGVLADLVTSLRFPSIQRLSIWAENPGLFLAAAYSAGSALALAAAPFIAGLPVYDRYLLGLVAVAPGPLVWWAQRRGAVRTSPVIPATSLIFLAFIAVIGFIAAGRLDSARWAMAEEIHRTESIPDGNIDAGFDWYRFHTEGIPRPDPWPPRYTWWSLDDARAVCATITYAQPPPAGIAVFPDESVPTLLERTVQLPFGAQVLLAKQGPDSCG